MTTANIPVVDRRHWHEGTADDRAAFVETIGEGLERLGFVAVTHHGIDPELLQRGYDVATEFFALPAETKLKYEAPEIGRQRGYTPFGVEHAKDQAVPDLKEFFHVGRVLPLDHPLVEAGDVPANVWPTAAVSAFEPTFRSLFGELETFALELLDAVGEYLGLDDDFFREMVRDGNSVHRIINYPDMGHVPAGAVRAAAHEDINLMTVLPSSTRPGLELLTRDGEWMAVETPPDVMICDTGDMMQLLTAGRLPATTHRVVNPEGSDGGRMSMPFFLHPHPDALLDPLTPGYADPVLTRDFFTRRMRETGVAK